MGPDALVILVLQAALVMMVPQVVRALLANLVLLRFSWCNRLSWCSWLF